MNSWFPYFLFHGLFHHGTHSSVLNTAQMVYFPCDLFLRACEKQVCTILLKHVQFFFWFVQSCMWMVYGDLTRPENLRVWDACNLVPDLLMYISWLSYHIDATCAVAPACWWFGTPLVVSNLGIPFCWKGNVTSRYLYSLEFQSQTTKVNWYTIRSMILSAKNFSQCFQVNNQDTFHILFHYCLVLDASSFYYFLKQVFSISLGVMSWGKPWKPCCWSRFRGVIGWDPKVLRSLGYTLGSSRHPGCNRSSPPGLLYTFCWDRESHSTWTWDQHGQTCFIGPKKANFRQLQMIKCKIEVALNFFFQVVGPGSCACQTKQLINGN